MKKLGLIVLFFLSVVFLAGCQETKLTLVVEVKDISDTLIVSKEIEFPSNSELSLFEIIDEAIELDYAETAYGPYIQGVEGFYPMDFGASFNYYLSLYVNGAESMVGLSDVEYSEDMVITFREASMLSSFDVSIDLWIKSFIENSLTTYISETGISQHVVSALKQLENYGYVDINWNDFSYPEVKTDTLSNLFKSTLSLKVRDLALTEVESALLAINPTNPYDAVTYLNTLDVIYGKAVNSKRAEVATYLQNNNPEYMDADFAAMALTAVANHQDDAFNSYILNMTNYIKDAQTNAGIESWGSANASSTASAILGLLAVGIDPRSEAFTVADVDLIEALMTFAFEGGFKYTLQDTKTDLAFSTPQAFSALVAYKIYRDHKATWEVDSMNLWDLSINN